MHCPLRVGSLHEMGESIQIPCSDQACYIFAAANLVSCTAIANEGFYFHVPDTSQLAGTRIECHVCCWLSVLAGHDNDTDALCD